MVPGSDDNFNLEWGASFPLEGEIQTVPRAELFTIVILLKNLQHEATVIIVSDSLVNIELYYKGKAHALASTNGDLWVGVFQEISDKELTVTIHWVQGHLDTKDGKQWFPPLWRALNIGADHFANLAAKRFELSTDITIPVQINCELAVRIQKRLVHILCTFPDRKSVV